MDIFIKWVCEGNTFKKCCEVQLALCAHYIIQGVNESLEINI